MRPTAARVTPPREFADGQRVSMFETHTGQSREVVTVEGVVLSATLVGIRHPGYIYEVETADGAVRHMASGLLTAL